MPRNAEKAFDFKGYFALLVVIFITVFTLPSDWGKAKQVSIGHVWYYGWVTAISTGAGVIPFFFISEPNKFWMGISNGDCEIIRLKSFQLMLKLVQIN